MQRSTVNSGVATIALAAGLVCTTSVLGVGIDQIPSPRPAGWTVDLTGRVSPDTVKALNSLGDEIHSTPVLTDTTAASTSIWSSTSGSSSPSPSFDAGFSGGHSSGGGASGGW